MICDRIEATIHECAPDHSTQVVSVGDLRQLIALARIGYETKVPWKISRTVKHAGDIEI